MSKNKIVFTVGILLVILPFTGFPPAWKSIFLLIMGIVLIGLSFMVAAKRRASFRRNRRVRDRRNEATISPAISDAPLPLQTDNSSTLTSTDLDNTATTH